MARWGGQRKKLADRARETENRDRRKSAEGLLLTGGNNVSDQNNHNSLYENSEYPSRRQAPRRSERSGRSRKKRRRGGVAGSIFKVLGTLLLIGLCTGTILCCFAAVYIKTVIFPIADLSLDDFVLGENSVM